MSPVRRLIWSLLVAALTTGVLMAWRGYPWQLALLSGASIGALIFFTLLSIYRLRQDIRPLELTRDGTDSEDD